MSIHSRYIKWPCAGSLFSIVHFHNLFRIALIFFLLPPYSLDFIFKMSLYHRLSLPLLKFSHQYASFSPNLPLLINFVVLSTYLYTFHVHLFLSEEKCVTRNVLASKGTLTSWVEYPVFPSFFSFLLPLPPSFLPSLPSSSNFVACLHDSMSFCLILLFYSKNHLCWSRFAL